jgi:hypothetical protein
MNLYGARTFTIHIEDLFGILAPQEWDSRKMGVPNQDNLAMYMARFAETFLTGHNKHIRERRSVFLGRALVKGPHGEVMATWEGNIPLLRDNSDYEQDTPDPQHLLDAGLLSKSWFPRPWTCKDAILPLDYLDPRVDGDGTPLRSKGVPPTGFTAWEDWTDLGTADLAPLGSSGTDTGVVVVSDIPDLIFAPLPDHPRM